MTNVCSGNGVCNFLLQFPPHLKCRSTSAESFRIEIGCASQCWPKIIVRGAALFAPKTTMQRAHVSSFIWAVRGTVIKVSLEKWPDTWLLQLFQRQGANTFGYCLASSRNFYLHTPAQQGPEVGEKISWAGVQFSFSGDSFNMWDGYNVAKTPFFILCLYKVCVCVWRSMWYFLSLVRD